PDAWRSKLANAAIDRLDDLVRRRRAGGDADRPRADQPFAPDVGVGLNVVHPRTMPRARAHELPRVVAVLASDHDHDVAFAGQLRGGVLALLRRLTDGVDEPDVGPGEPALHQADEMPRVIDQVGGLGGDAESRALFEPCDIVLGQYHVERVEILGDSTHLHVIATADGHRMVAV